MATLKLYSFSDNVGPALVQAPMGIHSDTTHQGSLKDFQRYMSPSTNQEAIINSWLN